jgi:hypothetical protein
MVSESQATSYAKSHQTSVLASSLDCPQSQALRGLRQKEGERVRKRRKRQRKRFLTSPNTQHYYWFIITLFYFPNNNYWS